MTTAGTPSESTPGEVLSAEAARCGKPVEECKACHWRGGNRPEHPCIKCGGEVIVRPCQGWRVPGTPACVKHGSATAKARKAGRQRLARGQAAKTLRDVEVVPIGDPLDELANMAARIVALEQHAADKAAELGAEGSLEKAEAMAVVHRQLVNDAGKLLERCARLGIEGRRTDAMVAQGRQIAEVVRGALEAVFAALVAAAVDGRLELDMVVRVQHEQVPAIIRAQLAEAAGELGAGSDAK